MATYTPLSTDFKDDILASQNSKRKYTQVNNSDGTVSFQDSTAYSQVGSSYGAKEIIEEREAINNIYTNKLVTLDEIDLVTEPGFFVDAQVVKELNSKIVSGDFTTINLSGWIFEYKRLGNNLLWFNIRQNINNQSASPRKDQGIKIPFTLPFEQHSFGHINVAGQPVGEDIFSFYEDGSVYMGSTGYSGYATYHAAGILVIN